MKEFCRYFAKGIFEDQDQVVPVLDGVLLASASTNNQQIIAGISGKQIIVLSLMILSAGIATGVNFKSASAGTIKHYASAPANTVADPVIRYVPNLFGWFRTNAGEGLFVDIPSAVAVAITVNYIAVTPQA